MDDTIKVGEWELPNELFRRYLRVVEFTERTGKRYNYEFDSLRKSIHTEIMKYVGLKVHMNAYIDFQRALEDLCEEMLPDRFVMPIVTKLNPPI